MIDRCVKKPSLHRQCQILDINRSSVYYRPRPFNAENLKIMRLIDEQYLKTPVAARRLSMGVRFYMMTLDQWITNT